MNIINLTLAPPSQCFFDINEHRKRFAREGKNILFLQYSIDKRYWGNRDLIVYPSCSNKLINDCSRSRRTSPLTKVKNGKFPCVISLRLDTSYVPTFNKIMQYSNLEYYVTTKASFNFIFSFILQWYRQWHHLSLYWYCWYS